MTTDKAFADLINKRDHCISIGMSASNYRQLKNRFINNDRLLTIQTKIHWLEKAGYKYKINWIKSSE